MKKGNNAMLNIGILGATGYAGEELIDILLKHKYARIAYLAAKIDQPDNISSIFPKFKGRIDLVCTEPKLDEIIAKCDLVFLALPHTQSFGIVPKLLKAGKRVIDLSADYRLKDIPVYEKFYKVVHADKDNVKKAVYGLPEFYREEIKAAKLIANPGCYPTAAILATAPVLISGLVEEDCIFIDAKSGVSGAGRRAVNDLMFTEVNENFKAYKVNVHQHMPEIDQELSGVSKKTIKTNFVPHLLPVNRGILETIYFKLKKSADQKQVLDIYKRFYKKEPFVRVLDEGKNPQLKDVVYTNYCDIAVNVDPEKKTLIVVAAIDNLKKGASGQAVQNMNIMHGFAESEGLV
ncbi:MAG: N-acetyl-gamma-glutamyl-phosphate reductase [Candidatus Omnitrophica bacterium]|nr:N-acetyl-gamma-glutamyl-phosphate reductase [Candidatus Omnitrophota bacterium]MDD5610479.1 N-acetyl-gamma-glutamyl-phosphate reductase [Candidatus Omnitrophota bacterium]